MFYTHTHTKLCSITFAYTSLTPPLPNTHNTTHNIKTIIINNIYREYISLIVNEDASHRTLADLGKLSSIQFTDLNPDLTPFQRRYVSYVRRCDELERKLRFFGNECDNFGLNLDSAGDVRDFLESQGSAGSAGGGARSPTGSVGTGKGASGTQLLESLEVELEGKM